MSNALTVNDLVNTAHLQLSVLAGTSGLDRPLLWTHVSELENPGAWLDGGELLMTNGLGLPKDPEGQAKLIAELENRSAAGLAIGVRGPENQQRLLEEANRRAFPVLRVPIEVQFLTIARFVADANQHAAHQRLLKHVRIFDTLRPGSTPGGLENLFLRLEEISDYSLHLISASGVPMSPRLRPLPEGVLDSVREAQGQPDTRAPRIENGYVVPLPVEHRDGTYLVALEREQAEPAGLAAVRHIATIVALELSKTYYERETLRRRASESLSRFDAGQLSTFEAETSMSQAGFDRGEQIMVAAIRSIDGQPHDEEIHHRLCDFEIPSMLLIDQDLFAVLPAESGDLEKVLDGLAVIAGISGPRPGIHAWSVARKEASWALERAVMAPNADQIVHFPGAEGGAHWLPSHIGTLEALVSEILGPLLQYDAENNSSMLETLRVFFRHDRQLQSAAAELIVHKHTLSYRLKRIGEITGRDLATMSDQVQLWLALQAYEVVARSSEDVITRMLEADSKAA